MDKDELFIELITEKLHEKSSSANNEFDQRKAFIQILKTLHSILDEQSESIIKVNSLIEKIESIESSLDAKIVDLSKDTSNKLSEVKTSADEVKDSLDSIISNSSFWKKFWQKVLIFLAAIGTLVAIIAYLISFNFLKIQWTIH
jgi:predicted RNA-binding protein with EMAP domain